MSGWQQGPLQERGGGEELCPCSPHPDSRPAAQTSPVSTQIFMAASAGRGWTPGPPAPRIPLPRLLCSLGLAWEPFTAVRGTAAQPRMPRMPVALCAAQGTALAPPEEFGAGAGNPISTGQAQAAWGVVIKRRGGCRRRRKRDTDFTSLAGTFGSQGAGFRSLPFWWLLCHCQALPLN